MAWAINTRMTAPKPHPVPPGFKIHPPISPFFATLGKVYVRRGDDQSSPVFGLHVRPKHANHHGTGHGGFLATLVDTFMAAFVHDRRPEIARLWTMRLDMEYKRPAPMGGWLECHCVAVERDGGFVTARCELRHEGTVTNKATAIFKVIDRDPR